MDLNLDRYPLSMDDTEWRSTRMDDLQDAHPDWPVQQIMRLVGREMLVRGDARFQRDQDRKALREMRASASVEERESIDLRRHIARRIAAERIYARRNQRDLATAVGIPQSTFSDIEAGTRAVTAAELVLIAAELGCALEDFVGSWTQVHSDA